MFFSKVTLKQGPKLFGFLSEKSGSDGYAAHQLLWDLFPNDGSKKRDFLFYKDDRNGLPSFFVVSQEKPVETEALSVQSKEYTPQLSEGDKLAFTLVGNPVIARKTEGKNHSVKHDVWMDAKKEAKEKGFSPAEIRAACEDAAKEWLIRQGERTGFHCSEEYILIDGYQQNRFYKGKGKGPIRFSAVHYEGILTVTDPSAFTKMLAEGLGKSRAFGCGLMLVKRI